jgi:PAS domain S-box-containing protein
MKLNNYVPIEIEKIFDTMPGIVFWKSVDLRYSGANKRFLKLVGIKSLDQLVGRKDDQINWPKHHKDYFSQHDTDIISSGKPVFSIQKNILASGGNIVTIITDKYPIYGNDKNIIGVLGISSSIYDQQFNSQVYLHNIMEIIPYYIFWKNANLVYLGCNKKFAKLVGKKSPKDVIGKTDFDLGWGRGEAAAYQEGDRKTMFGKPTINLEEVLVRPDNSKIVMLVNKVPLLDKVGTCIGVLGTSTDITELKNTQNKLQEAEQRLAGIKALSASIAHELRTPLTAIQFGLSGTKNYLPKLVRAYNEAKKYNLDIEPIQSKNLQVLSEVFDNIESEVRYSETIINMLLMNVKQQRVSTANFKIISMNECVEEAKSRYPFKPEEEKLFNWDDKNNFMFYGDKTLMVHILFNLLKNSLYYIHAAEKGKIKVWYKKQENINILHFKDTGKGIPANVLPNVFEKFYTTTHHGTGLGLAFCKMVMTSFDGDITCTSEYGKFTLFELLFPAHEDEINS